MDDATRKATISRAIDNYLRILVALTEVIANPTQANIDAAVSAAATDSKVNFSLTYSLDGESYNWESYGEHVKKQIRELRELEQLFDGPWEIHVRAY